MKRSFLVFLFFFLVSFIQLRGILTLKGVVIGSDWGLPQTQTQINEYYERGQYLWTNEASLFGRKQALMTSFPFQLFMKSLAGFGLTGDEITKILIFGIYNLAAISMYFLLRYLKMAIIPSMFASVAFIASPIFFNYTIMGWMFVLLSLSMCPIFIIFVLESVKKNNLGLALMAGLIFSLSVIQTQTLVWWTFILIFIFPFAVTGKKEFWIYVKNVVVIYTLLVLLNSFWIIPLLFFQDSTALGSGLVLEPMSLGTWARLSYRNLIRTWGSLYNYQFETSYLKGLQLFSFIPTVFAFGLLFWKGLKKQYLPFVLMFILPMVFYFLGPNVINKLPYSNIIRDVARFTYVSTIGLIVLMGYFFDSLYKKDNVRQMKSVILFFIVIGISAHPFWLNRIVGSNTQGYDVRLRAYSFPNSYRKVENILNIVNSDQKVLYVPLGEVQEVKSDPELTGIYRGVRDIYALFSPKPGALTYYQSGAYSPTDFSITLKQLYDNNKYEPLSELLRIIGVSYVAVRTDLKEDDHLNIENYLKYLDQSPDYKLEYKSEEISLYSRFQSKGHIYVPDSFKVVQSLHYLDNFLTHSETSNKPSFIYQGSVGAEMESKITSIENNMTVNTDTLMFAKHSPVNYSVDLTCSSSLIPIVFNETYHPGWKLYIKKDKSGKPVNIAQNFLALISMNQHYEVPESNHFIANGYANGWLIEKDSLCQADNTYSSSNFCDGDFGRIELNIYFSPQRLFYIGLAISIVTLFGCFTYLGCTYVKTRRRRMVNAGRDRI